MSGMPQRPRARALAAAATLAFSMGCTDRVTDPAPVRTNPSRSQADVVAHGEATASVRWSAVARDFIAAKPAAEKPNQQAAFRVFAYLSLAQYRAAVAAHHTRGYREGLAPPPATATGSPEADLDR